MEILLRERWSFYRKRLWSSIWQTERTFLLLLWWKSLFILFVIHWINYSQDVPNNIRSLTNQIKDWLTQHKNNQRNKFFFDIHFFSIEQRDHQISLLSQMDQWIVSFLSSIIQLNIHPYRNRWQIDFFRIYS